MDGQSHRNTQTLLEQRSEIEFQAYALDQHAIVSRADIRGRITHVNDKFVEISGYSRDELIGKNYCILDSGKHSPKFFKEMWRTISSGKTWQGEICNKSKAGDFYWVQCTIIPKFDEKGKLLEYLSIRTDVTQIKQTKRTELWLEFTLGHIQNEVYMFDPATLKFLYVNQAVADHLGWSIEEMLDFTPLDIKPEFTEQSFRETLQPLILGEKSKKKFETIHMRRDGSLVPVEIDLQFVSSPDDEPRFVAIVQDISERKAAERAIENFKTSLDLEQNLVYMFWADSFEYIYLNRAAQEYSNLENYRGVTAWDHMSAEKVESFMERGRSLINGDESLIGFEVYDKQNDRQLYCTMQLIRPEGGAPRYYLNYQDISERKLSEMQIRKFKSTLDLIQSEIYFYHPETLQYTYLNRTALNRTGWSENEVHEKTPADLHDDFTKEFVKTSIAPLISGEKKSIVFIKPDERGEIVEVTQQLIKPEGEEPRIVAIGRNITARRQAERDMRNFQKTLDMTEDLVHIFRPEDLKFTYLNKAALQHYGWEQGEYYDYTPADTRVKLDVTEYQKSLLPLMDRQKSSIIYEAEDKLGTVHENVVQLIDFGTAGKRYVAISRDVTERRAVEKRKAEFLATVSHELRTPLTAIKGTINLIDSGALGKMPAPAERLLDSANRNAERLLELINGILDLAKLESGKMEFFHEPFDLCELLNEAVFINQAFADKYQVILRTQKLPESCQVIGDGQRIMQVLTNLLSNAVKFSRSNSVVDIQIGPSEKAGWVTISVIDSGRGIPKNMRATVFDKFVQADSSDTRGAGGTGLGLSVAKEIVENHGGELSFKSEEGKGTTFYFDLPIETTSNSDYCVQTALHQPPL